MPSPRGRGGAFFPLEPLKIDVGLTLVHTHVNAHSHMSAIQTQRPTTQRVSSSSRRQAGRNGKKSGVEEKWRRVEKQKVQINISSTKIGSVKPNMCLEITWYTWETAHMKTVKVPELLSEHLPRSPK